MQNIERRAGRDLFYFTMVDPDYYESLENYMPKRKNFRTALGKHVPAEWDIQGGNGLWYYVLPPEDKTPDQGFKIHVSTIHENALECIDCVVPILIEFETAFKILVDDFMLTYMNSQNNSRSAAGKFMAIYPHNLEHFKELLSSLHEATRHLKGPYILSDKAFDKSQILFYRYGGFKIFSTLNIYGEKIPLIRTQKGTIEPDNRQPFFILPEGIEDPFHEPEEDDGSSLLNDRYQFLSALSFSPKGGVYKCTDTLTGKTVVIKEARPYINMSEEYPVDAVATLQREYEILEALAGSGYTPKPVEIYKEWQHYFLVQEFIEGHSLAAFRAEESFNIMLKTGYTSRDIRLFSEKLLSVFDKLLTGIRAIHQKGFVLADLAPQNVLYDDDSGELRFIDLEGAYQPGRDSSHMNIGTLSFASGSRLRGNAPTTADDYYALGGILFNLIYPVNIFFSLHASGKNELIDFLIIEKGLPPLFRDLIFALADTPEKVDSIVLALRESLTTLAEPAAIETRVDADYLGNIISGIHAHINSSADYERESRIFPADYRIFMTNPLNIAYGYLGTAVFLKRTGGDVPQELLSRLNEQVQAVSLESYPPGLYVGISGIIWALEELGLREQAIELTPLPATSPLLAENADLFYGTAGWGLTCLYLYDRIGDDIYLQQALQAASLIKNQLQRDDNGYFFVNAGEIFHSLAHGGSGIAYFWLRLYEATGDASHLHYATETLRYEIAQAESHDTHLQWARSNIDDQLFTPYWRFGSAGIISVLTRFYDSLGEREYLDIAEKGAYYLAGKYSLFPGLFEGMTGLGEALLDVYYASGNSLYHEEALRFARRILLFRIERESGIAFPGDELVRISHDFGTGSAGIGLFFHRIFNPMGRLFYDF